MSQEKQESYIRWFDSLSSNDIKLVGGKNASLGEMIATLKDKGIRVPDGFATTSDAYWEYVKYNNLEEDIRSELDQFKSGEKHLEDAGKAIRNLFEQGDFPDAIADQIRQAYRELSTRYDSKDIAVAARSSATAEDLPEASFAGQLETFLNISGEENVLDACRSCIASLFTDRAITYREENNFDHMQIALSVGIQKMVRSDKAGAGVSFTLDTDNGFRDVVLINAGWGLGENVVKGTINPDEYRVFKPLLDRENLVPIIDKTLGDKHCRMIISSDTEKPTENIETTEEERKSFVLSDQEILQVAIWSRDIEEHYEKPMDIEWAKDGELDEIFIVQARPETVQSRKAAATLKNYELKEKGKPILEGMAIGQSIVSAKAKILSSPDEGDRFEDGDILVTEMTNPDWGPLIKRAAGIVTDSGGRTSHAAIVSREMNIPAVVGTGSAMDVLKDGQEITLSCAEGPHGYVYEGKLEYEESVVDLEEIPKTETQIMMNIASPDAAFRWWRLPVKGIGLARMEFIINNIIKVHPMALVRFDSLEDEKARKEISELTRNYEDKTEYFVEQMARGIAKIAASRYPYPVIIRLSDFKTNEYADLIGGKQFEPKEANPMLGVRGASRYYSNIYKEGFSLECRAVKKAREEIGLDNVVVMIPFCRTPEEADRVLDIMADNGLERGKQNLQLYIMAEIPSNIILAEEFAKRCDGFSIGSNDLTQLVLGVDRDSTELREIYDENNEAVRRMIKELIDKSHQSNTPVSICGEAPSDKLDLTAFLVKAGIDSISVNPDSVMKVIEHVARVEKQEQPTKAGI